MKIYDDYIKFIDYIVNAISNGKYIYYQLSLIPMDKMEKEGFIDNLDNKLLNKYETGLDKAKRLNLRRKNKARHLGARYQNIIILLKTKGETEVAPGDKWIDIRKKKIEIKLGKYTTYNIGVGPTKKKKNDKSLDFKVDVTLSADTLNYIKLNCLDCIKNQKNIRKLIYEWNKINGINGWSGVNKQKLQLKNYLAGEVSRSFGLTKEKALKLFRVNTYKAKNQKKKEKEIIVVDVDFDGLEKAFEDNTNGLDSACLGQATDITPVAPMEQ